MNFFSWTKTQLSWKIALIAGLVTVILGDLIFALAILNRFSYNLAGWLSWSGFPSLIQDLAYFSVIMLAISILVLIHAVVITGVNWIKS